MEFSFAEAVAALGRDAAFRLANTARPPADYVLNTILPERNMSTYHVTSGSMRVLTTMAGLVGMDSPYPPGGLVEISTFLEQTAKIANEVSLSEAALRELQTLWTNLFVTGGNTREFLQEEALNFLQKVVIQAHLDRMEWMRGQALGLGTIDWTFNGKRVVVDYGIPAANILTERTDANNDAYFDTASAFWTDVREARRILRNNIRAVIGRPQIIEDILYNSANNIRITGNPADGVFDILRLQGTGADSVPSEDLRDRIRLIIYDKEGEILDLSNPGRTVNVPFFPDGRLAFIGNAPLGGYRIGQGTTPDPDEDLAIGYTHLAPTVEGNNMPGRWSNLYVPEQEPWSLHGRGVTNGLPVIENPDVIVIARSELSS